MYIQSPNGSNFTALTVSVTGAYATATQTTSTGAVTAFANQTSVAEAIGTTVGAARWFWDEHPGVHEITVQASYANGTSGTTVIDVNVASPTYSLYKDVYQKLIFTPFATAGINSVGFLQIGPGGEVGNAFTATVSLPPGRNGNFGFIQLVESSRTIGFRNSTPLQVNTNGFVLDNWTGSTGNPILLSGYSAALSPNGNGTVSPNGEANDSPNLGGKTNLFPTGDYITGFEFDYKFKTYLVFQAYTSQNTGIWVAIGNLSWEVEGAAIFNNQNYTSQSDYADPAHWTINVRTPATAGTINGTAGNTIPKWSDYIKK